MRESSDDGAREGIGARVVCYATMPVPPPTRAELLLLAGSVNEAIEAVEDWEFPIRVGAEKAAARTLRSELANLIARLPAELPGQVGLGQMLG